MHMGHMQLQAQGTGGVGGGILLPGGLRGQIFILVVVCLLTSVRIPHTTTFVATALVPGSP